MYSNPLETDTARSTNNKMRIKCKFFHHWKEKKALIKKFLLIFFEIGIFFFSVGWLVCDKLPNSRFVLELLWFELSHFTMILAFDTIFMKI